MSCDKIWVAKFSDNLGMFHEFELSPRFSDINDCQKFIDENLKDINDMLFKLLCTGTYKDSIEQIIFTSGNFIRCYNLRDKRFCTGFDY